MSMSNGIRNQLTVLDFKTMQTHACIDLSCIDKIIPLIELKQLPNSPAYVVGLLNLNGQCIPVVDFDMRVGLIRNNHYTINSSIILCCMANKKIGIVVDDVLGLAMIDSQCVQMNDEFNHANSLFQGTTTIHGDLSLLVNTNNFCEIDAIVNSENADE